MSAAPHELDPRVPRDTREDVRHIISAGTADQYDARLYAFLAGRDRLYRRIGSGFLRNNSARAEHLEDVMAIVREVEWWMVGQALQDDTYLDRVQSWEAILRFNARPKVRSHLDHVRSPASGMVSAQRRFREIQRTRNEIRNARGVGDSEMSTGEVIRLTNERLAATRSDPTRQGMVVSAADVAASRESLSFDDTLGTAPTVPHVDSPDDCILHPAEGPVLVATVIERAYEVSLECGEVARMWMEDAYSSGGPPPATDTIAWIARGLGLRRDVVDAHVDVIRAIAVNYLRTIGISESDV